MDINAILSAALKVAVEQATTQLADRINALEQQLRVEQGTSAELTRRIDLLSSQHVAMGERISAIHLTAINASERLGAVELGLTSITEGEGDSRVLRVRDLPQLSGPTDAEPATPMHPASEQALSEAYVNLSTRLSAVEAHCQNAGDALSVAKTHIATLEHRCTSIETVLGSVLDITDIDDAADQARAGVTPSTTRAFDQRLIEAVEANADDFITALKEGDTDELMGGSVAETVADVIRNGTFEVSFNRY